jgi:hypothetical protein
LGTVKAGFEPIQGGDIAEQPAPCVVDPAAIGTEISINDVLE